MNDEITMSDIHGAFPHTVQVLGKLMAEFRQEAEENPRIILRELTDDPRDDNIREGIMVLARDTTDPRIRAWYTALLDMSALRYAKNKVRDLEETATRRSASDHDLAYRLERDLP